MSVQAQRTVVWLDDELDSPYQYALAPFQEALEQRVGRFNARLIRCPSLERFADAIRGCFDGGGEIALLVIDVMLNFEEDSDFGTLGFDNERLIPLEAGARIAGLVRSSEYDAIRPRWLAQLMGVPMLILSASPDAPAWVRREVGASRMDGVAVVLKDMVKGASDHMTPVAPFSEALERLLGA